MQLRKIIDAYNTTEALAEAKGLSNDEQWKIYKVRKNLRSHMEFANERLNKLKDKYQEFADENGLLNGDKAIEYNKEITELYNMNVDMDDYDIPSIRVVEGVTFKVIEPLEEFINFIPG